MNDGSVLPSVRQIEAAGAATHRAIAVALNARGIRPVRGGAWHDSTGATCWRVKPMARCRGPV
jgi:hypothetical protein